MVYHLQGGFEGIQLQSSAEHANFNRVRVHQVDRRVASGTGVFSVVHLFEWRKANSIPCCPAVHLGLGAAAEPQQLRPKLFHKVEQTGNRGLLLFVSTAKGQARDVNVQAASACRMTKITHALRFAEDFRPRHFVQMVL